MVSLFEHSDSTCDILPIFCRFSEHIDERSRSSTTKTSSSFTETRTSSTNHETSMVSMTNGHGPATSLTNETHHSEQVTFKDGDFPLPHDKSEQIPQNNFRCFHFEIFWTFLQSFHVQESTHMNGGPKVNNGMVGRRTPSPPVRQFSTETREQRNVVGSSRSDQ